MRLGNLVLLHERKKGVTQIQTLCRYALFAKHGRVGSYDCISKVLKVVRLHY